MQAYVAWWILAAVLVGVELTSGTFYLPVYGLAAAAAGVAAWLGAGTLAQLVTAGAIAVLGKFHAVLGPGLNLVIPFFDTVAYKHSLKEIPLDVPSQVCITRDNTQPAVDGILYFQGTFRSPTPKWRPTDRATIYRCNFAAGAGHLALDDRPHGNGPHFRGA